MVVSEHMVAIVLERFSAILKALGEFYELHDAIAWCESPQVLLDGKASIELLTTDEGVSEVVSTIRRLQDGVFA